jgi:hypothetical protein
VPLVMGLARVSGRALAPTVTSGISRWWEKRGKRTGTNAHRMGSPLLESRLLRSLISRVQRPRDILGNPYLEPG